jgi:hypothetical protein
MTRDLWLEGIDCGAAEQEDRHLLLSRSLFCLRHTRRSRIALNRFVRSYVSAQRSRIALNRLVSYCSDLNISAVARGL